MNKTNLLKMRVESGECIYLGRKGQKVFVWDEEGNDLDVAKLPVYPRKYIKNKLESIPELALGFVFDYEGCDGGITGQGDETPTDETPVVDETPADETPADETPVDETPVDETPADDASTEEIETETEEVKVEEPVSEEIVEEALPTKLADLKELAEKLKKEAEVKTGKEIKVDIQSLRKKDDVIEKIGKLKELLK